MSYNKGMITENETKPISNENVTLAIKWGTGYRLIKPPYQSRNDFEFIYGFAPPPGCVIVTTKEACGAISEYLKRNNIKAYSLKFGIMTFELIGDDVVLRYNGATSGKPRKPRIYRRNKRVVNIVTMCQYLGFKEKIGNPHLQGLIKELKEYVINLSSDLNLEPLRLWESLFKSEMPPINPEISKKVSVIEHYSNGTNKCNGCGATDLRVLTIDHVNGDGSKHRKEIHTKGGRPFYSWLINNKYPDGFQVLCLNCQMIKRSDNHEI